MGEAWAYRARGWLIPSSRVFKAGWNVQVGEVQACEPVLTYTCPQIPLKGTIMGRPAPRYLRLRHRRTRHPLRPSCPPQTSHARFTYAHVHSFAEPELARRRHRHRHTAIDDQ